MFIDSFWSLLPPIIAIVLALITKEVYSSLLIGIVAGGLLYSGFSPTGAMQHIFVDGMIAQLSDSWNVGILVFLVILGTIVTLMNKAGGSAAFGRWAAAHVKTREGAQVSTVLLGMLIFIDDYFNCLTVGSVMRPVTDKHKISREKLAYIIDATAAPVCIIAPISSWAAAVTGFVKGVNGLTLFIRAIPYNFYALLSIVMMFALIAMKFDYGAMKQAEARASENGLKDSPGAGEGSSGTGNQPAPPVSEKGKVIHLVFPIVTLIICCVMGMIYTGGFFEGTGFVDAFSGSDASVGLVYGSAVALILTDVFFIITGVSGLRDCMNSISKGFKSMVPAILILTFAWTLKSMTDSLGAANYVAGIFEQVAENNAIISFIPAVVFLVAAFLAFSTGTSWGTFGILIPIVVHVFGSNIHDELMVIAISACMAGAVCGDHCSPISDTTIMASAGAQCDHIKHVSTQLPYAFTVAAVSFVVYIISGFVRNWSVCLCMGIVLMLGTLFAIKKSKR